MPATIRQLTPAEISTLTPSTFQLAPIFEKQSLYASPYGALLLAEVDHKPAGTAALDLSNPAAATIDHFVISPSFRGHGVGSTLMLAVLDHARSKNAKTIRAHIPPWCPDWRGFYTRFKFRFTDPKTQDAMTDSTPVELEL